MSERETAEPVELAINGVSCVRDGRTLFTQLEYNCPRGTVLQVLGFNGAGKTTLLNALAGLLPCTEGEILWRGHPIRRSRAFTAEVFYLGHQVPVKPSLTVWENLHWLARLRGQAVAAEQGLQALAQVDLDAYHGALCRNLSAGQKRRVALAQLYLSGERLWILDEPFTAIDKEGVARLQDLLQQHAERGGIAVITSHQALALPGLKTLNLSDYQPLDAYDYA